MQPSREEFVEWLNHPTTKVIQKVLQEQLKDARINLSNKILFTAQEKLIFQAGRLSGIEDTINFKELFVYSGQKEDDDD